MTARPVSLRADTSASRMVARTDPWGPLGKAFRLCTLGGTLHLYKAATEIFPMVSVWLWAASVMGITTACWAPTTSFM